MDAHPSVNASEGTNVFEEKRCIVPCHATGLVIGKKGANIKRLQQCAGVDRCTLRDTGPNSAVLVVRGLKHAVDAVVRDVESTIADADRHLRNDSRATHSWTVLPSGEVALPRVVHKTGDPPPRPHSTGVGRNFHAARKRGKRVENEKERIRDARERAERS